MTLPIIIMSECGEIISDYKTKYSRPNVQNVELEINHVFHNIQMVSIHYIHQVCYIKTP